MPRSIWTVGGAEVVIKVSKALLIVTALPVVVSADPPAGVRIFQQMLDAFVLLLLSDVQKQFDQQVAVVAQLAFKDADFLQTALVLLDREAARLILADGLVHPAGIEEEEFAVFRDVFHVTVQKRLGKLLGCGTGHRDDLKEAWVHRCNHRSDAAALSGSTPTFHQHNDRKGALFDQ